MDRRKHRAYRDQHRRHADDPDGREHEEQKNAAGVTVHSGTPQGSFRQSESPPNEPNRMSAIDGSPMAVSMMTASARIVGLPGIGISVAATFRAIRARARPG